MKICFTGSRCGMTRCQERTLLDLLKRLRPTEFHHGDCFGADARAHALAAKLGIETHAHPGTDMRGQTPERARCLTDVIHDAKPYLDRNQDLVNLLGVGDVLIACPKEREEVLRSGTWSTIRRARKAEKNIIYVWPGGGPT